MPELDVLFLLCVNNLGGAELSNFRLIRGLHHQGFRVGLVAYGARPDLIPHDLGAPVFWLGVQRTFRAAWPLTKILRQHRPRVLISSFTDTSLMALIVLRIARLSIKCIVLQHNPLFMNRTRDGKWRVVIHRFLTRILYPCADYIVAVSEALAAPLRTELPRACNVRTLYNPVLPLVAAHTDQTPHPWLESGQPPVIMGVGRLAEEKNFDLLLRAFARVAELRDARLIILGDGDCHIALEQRAAELHIADKVLLPGFVAAVEPWLRRASAFVLSSNFEGFGNVLVEALACGIPCIATDCPFGPAEILGHGRYGTLVPVGDVEAMTRAIEQSLDHPPPTSALAHHLEQFTETRSVAAYGAMIHEMLGSDA